MKHLLRIVLTTTLQMVAISTFAQGQRPAHLPKLQFGHEHHSASKRASHDAGHAARNVNSTVVVPGRNVRHRWDDQTNTWNNGTVSVYTYDVKGNPTQIIETDSATSVPLHKEILSYNGQNQVTEHVYQQWNGTAYVNDNREQVTYDAQGYETLYYYQVWENNAWTIDTGYRTTTTYNPAGVLISQVYENYNVDSNTWEQDGRQTFTVNASNQWTDIVNEAWRNGAYINEYRIRNITWYDWAKLQPSYLEEQEWNRPTSTWGEDSRSTFTFQPNGSYILIAEDLVAPNTWVNAFRSTNTFDNFGNETLYQDEEWVTNTWVTEYGYRYLFSYTATNQVRRAVEQDYSTTTNRYENYSVDTYGNFLTLSNRKATGLEATASLAPNPTLSSTTITVSGLREHGTVQAEVLNTVGQVVTTMALRSQQGTIKQEVNLGALPAGVYTIRLHTTEGTIAKRVVKQ
ncbi:T9SS type A sorting domain-containing protein [uncultured Hymenobacter sp.]|uniref:T9SS type A sorting domain-containing protein n=1 Tax=uncultured Hymenobacter sp. TaxID=170016 RepID=UPI0035CB26C2